MRAFEELVEEAAAADVTGWGFDWLHGRATEERPPWGYAKLLAGRLGQVQSALDIDTGSGEVLSEAPRFPPRMVATEGWPANAQRVRELLAPRGVRIIGSIADAPDQSFELVTARHPVRPDWDEIHRVLIPGGYYFGQHEVQRHHGVSQEHSITIGVWNWIGTGWRTPCITIWLRSSEPAENLPVPVAPDLVDPDPVDQCSPLDQRFRRNTPRLGYVSTHPSSSISRTQMRFARPSRSRRCSGPCSSDRGRPSSTLRPS